MVFLYTITGFLIMLWVTAWMLLFGLVVGFVIAISITVELVRMQFEDWLDKKHVE